jgi:hypothetical protein
MNFRANLSLPRRPLLVGLLLLSAASLAIGFTAGAVLASSGTQSPHASPTTPELLKNVTGSNELGLPAGGRTTVLPGVGQGSSGYAGGTASAGSAGSGIAYPISIYPSLGVAPENTILAAGAGTADVKADGSDRAAALKKATETALADAKAQAQVVASAMGVQLTGIYSVSVSSMENYSYPIGNCAVPMPLTPGAEQSGTTTVVPSPGGSPEICVQGKTASPASMQLAVTVVVAYRFA